MPSQNKKRRMSSKTMQKQEAHTKNREKKHLNAQQQHFPLSKNSPGVSQLNGATPHPRLQQDDWVIDYSHHY
jgi:hypothetical protein